MVEGGGFEPPKAPPTDLQSVPFDRSGTPPHIPEDKRQKADSTQDCWLLSGFCLLIAQLELAMGLEPATP